jgi:hypothetical protein
MRNHVAGIAAASDPPEVVIRVGHFYVCVEKHGGESIRRDRTGLRARVTRCCRIARALQAVSELHPIATMISEAEICTI